MKTKPQSWSLSVEGGLLSPAFVFRVRLGRLRRKANRQTSSCQDAVDGGGKGSRLIRINPVHCKVSQRFFPRSQLHDFSCRCHRRMESAFPWAACKARLYLRGLRPPVRDIMRVHGCRAQASRRSPHEAKGEGQVQEGCQGATERRLYIGSEHPRCVEAAARKPSPGPRKAVK